MDRIPTAQERINEITHNAMTQKQINQKHELELARLDDIVDKAMDNDFDVIGMRKVIDALDKICNDPQIHILMCDGKRDRLRRVASGIFSGYIDIKARINEALLLTRQEIQSELLKKGEI